MHETFDFVIAGAGSAGCVLAARLAASGQHSVCLIEAGRKSAGIWSNMPAGNGFLFGDPNYDWGFRSIPQTSLFGRQIYYPRGKGAGGSSLMNGMIYIRGTAGDYDRWHQMGLMGWSYGDLLPYFRRSAQAAHRQGDPYHGHGPLKISPAGNYDQVNDAFIRACIQSGVSGNDDFNGASQEGAGRLDTTVWQGRRQSSARAYLDPQPPSLKFLTKTHVCKIVFESNKAVGLELSTGVIRARREVILCLGAFGTPQLLMLSGVGPGGHLQALGIQVFKDLPGVGSTLFDHPQFPLKYAVRDPAFSLARFQRTDRAAALAWRYWWSKTGAGAAPFWSAALFHSLRDRQNPELEVYLTPMCVTEEAAKKKLSCHDLLNIGTQILSRGKNVEAGLQFDICLLRPKSSGSVRLKSPEPFDHPLIDPSWFQDPLDMQDMIEGIRFLRKIARMPALEAFIGRETQPGNDMDSQRSLEQAVRTYVSTGHHPVSTCRMGAAEDPGAVLDQELKVRGIEGLRVVDASAFPDQIGGNPNAPIMMMAEKAADLILSNPAPPPEYPGNQQDYLGKA